MPTEETGQPTYLWCPRCNQVERNIFTVFKAKKLQCTTCGLTDDYEKFIVAGALAPDTFKAKIVRADMPPPPKYKAPA